MKCERCGMKRSKGGIVTYGIRWNQYFEDHVLCIECGIGFDRAVAAYLKQKKGKK